MILDTTQQLYADAVFLQNFESTKKSFEEGFYFHYLFICKFFKDENMSFSGILHNFFLENHKKRLEAIKKQLAEDSHDSWLRPSINSILGL